MGVTTIYPGYVASEMTTCVHSLYHSAVSEFFQILLLAIIVLQMTGPSMDCSGMCSDRQLRGILTQEATGCTAAIAINRLLKLGVCRIFMLKS